MLTEQVQIIRSGRKTVAVQVNDGGQVIVRAPRNTKKDYIMAYVAENEAWINKRLEEIRARKAAADARGLPRHFSQEQLDLITARAEERIPPLVDAWAKYMRVTYGKITIQQRLSRWGSCRGNGDLTFNCLIMLCPPPVREYVIVHELCHRRVMDHSPLFWKAVERYCPHWRESRKWLNGDGNELIERMRKQPKGDKT